MWLVGKEMLLKGRALLLYLVPVLIPVFCPQLGLATGWNDYTLPIAPGYQIFKCNDLEIDLVDGKTGSIIYSPDNDPRSGPITGYIVAPKHIFLRTAGKTPRNAFQGDTFIEVDRSVEYFFAVDRSNNSLQGPMSLPDFMADANVTALGSVNWIVPTNPNPQRARAGQRVFLLVAVFVYSVPLLFFGVVILTIVRLFRPKKPR